MKEKSQLGGGDLSDQLSYYEIKVSSVPGYRYRVHLEISWRDGHDLEREGSFSFDKELEFRFPSKLLQWETLFRKSKRVSVVVPNFFIAARSLVERIQSWEVSPAYTILVPSHPHNPETSGQVSDLDKLDQVAVIPDDEYESIARIVGKQIAYGHTYHNEFAILDEETVLLQDKNRPHRAEIIKDAVYVARVKRAFDLLADRFIR